ncbi:SUKH-3 domain-containing protein [Kitasatospora sp. NPDC085879]|uniref:SUKH-3 domain-containing protein n=1 Tax=Kitasatospora sp. NPDC085879 TaxID=3154769 RepID=UPI000BB1141A|nr:SUKH-3 domain-containing protein [Streptomyces sp. TLI_235]PBC75929.1 SUKH-3 immunity protein of toxin-antitoxin system [Streptomyces sp. TLI_235]
MSRFSDETERELLAAGWRPGRKVDVLPWRRRLESSGFHMHAAAELFLSEFGGLTVDVDGPGISCARVPFELDPSLADGEDDRFSEWGQEVGEEIFPIGEMDGGRYFLGISSSSEIYIVADWLASLGVGVEALERLVRGIAADTVCQ